MCVPLLTDAAAPEGTPAAVPGGSGVGGRLLPGLCVAATVGAGAYGLHRLGSRIVPGAALDTLLLAILVGAAIRMAWQPSAVWEPGIEFASRQVLELAIVLLGATVSLPLLLSGGGVLLAGIVATVCLALVAGTLIGRALGLAPRHALLVAAGNAICGNSAIAALAPVIGARREQVASSIAFTALLGVLVILSLPLLVPLLGLTHYEYGVVAGMSVYAVPQVLAAAFPVSALSGEVATLVKLIRVLLLGPVLLAAALGLRWWERRGRSANALSPGEAGPAPTVGRFAGKLVPWFVAGFLLLAVARSVHLVPDALASALRSASHWLTVLAMAALGLGVDVRALRRAGPRVVGAGIVSLLVIVVASVTLARAL